MVNHETDRRSLETRVADLEMLLHEIRGMVRLLKWLFASLLFLGFGPLFAEKTRQFLVALSVR